MTDLTVGQLAALLARAQLVLGLIVARCIWRWHRIRLRYGSMGQLMHGYLGLGVRRDGMLLLLLRRNVLGVLLFRVDGWISRRRSWLHMRVCGLLRRGKWSRRLFHS